MRFRSALAAALLTAALTATATATATAVADHPRHVVTDGGECDTYFGGIDTSSSDIFWGGAYCDGQ